jgi:carbamoyltransferase
MLLIAPVQETRQLPMDMRDFNGGDDDMMALINQPRSDVPAITHVDYSARIQTVHADTNPRFHALLAAFKQRTGCPVLVNTSFNVRGEPIVGTPEDAFRCFMGSDIEVLAIGNCLLRKEEQNPALKLDYKEAFELD